MFTSFKHFFVLKIYIYDWFRNKRPSKDITLHPVYKYNYIKKFLLNFILLTTAGITHFFSYVYYTFKMFTGKMKGYMNIKKHG